jgi:hypothetical protein
MTVRLADAGGLKLPQGRVAATHYWLTIRHATFELRTQSEIRVTLVVTLLSGHTIYRIKHFIELI